MLILTDNPDYSEHIHPLINRMQPVERISFPENLQPILQVLYPERDIFVGNSETNHGFKYFFLSEHVSFSQYDMLLRFANLSYRFRDNMLCFAGSGNNFHGFRQRSWSSIPGNIHLSILLHPGKNINFADSAFLILAANAVTQTINQLERMKQKAKIRWVNDIMIDQCKVGGVLVQTQIMGKSIDKVVLGIGLNVDKSPDIANDQFVNKTTHINQHVDGKAHSLKYILAVLISQLERNYQLIMKNNYKDLLNYYRDHSIVIGKYVEIYSDPQDGKIEKIAEGVVSEMTEKLELVLSGRNDVVRQGRIKLLNSA